MKFFTVLSFLEIDCNMKLNLNTENIKELQNFAFFKALLNTKLPYLFADKNLQEEEGSAALNQDINHIISSILMHYNASELQQEGLTNSLLMIHDVIDKNLKIDMFYEFMNIKIDVQNSKPM